MKEYLKALKFFAYALALIANIIAFSIVVAAQVPPKFCTGCDEIHVSAWWLIPLGALLPFLLIKACDALIDVN